MLAEWRCDDHAGAGYFLAGFVNSLGLFLMATKISWMLAAGHRFKLKVES